MAQILHHFFRRRYSKTFLEKLSFLLLFMFITQVTAFSQASFTKNNIVVLRVGDGSSTLANTGNPVFLDEYSTSGSFVQAVSLPTTTNGANKRLILTGTAASEGMINRSTDFKYLAIIGYDATPPYTSNITQTASTLVNRTIALVKYDGTINTTTALTDAYGGNTSTSGAPRSIATTDGTKFWTSGNANSTAGAGTRYTTLGSTTSTQLSSTPTNVRNIGIFNNQLYITSASGVFLGVSSVGSGTPQATGNTTTALSGFPTTSGPSPYGFAISPDGNTIYLADDRNTSSGGGIQKWVNNSGTWSLSYVISTVNVRGLVVDWSGTNPILYATTTETSANKIVKGVDTGASSSMSTLATASSSTVFRGIAFAPYDDAAVVVPNLSINDVTVTEGNVGTTTMTFTVTLSSPAPAGGVTFDIATADNTATVANNDYVSNALTAQTIAQGETTKTFSVTINGDTDPESNETFFVNITTVTGANVSDAQGLGTITNDDVNCATPTLISTIQGTGVTTSFSGTQVIRGIVVGDFQNTGGVTRLGGFYVQEEDADQDGNPATAEGIFVFEGSGAAIVDVNVGDLVCVSGTVAEYASGASSSLTQLTSPIISIVSSGNPLPTPQNVQLPIANTSDWERYEGMRVIVKAASGNLAVTDNYTLGQYGQLTLSSGGGNNQPGTDARLDQYTQFNTPSTAGYATHEAENAKRIVILDDGRSGSYPDPIIFGRGGNPLSASNTLRTGDEVEELAGVLDHRFEGYRIQTLTSPNFIATNTRPATPPSLGAATLKVGSANILNYFNGNGAGGGFPTSRGADNLNEFNRQRAKIINGIVTGGADVVGLMELEDDGAGAASAIQDLVNGLNAATASGTYDFVRSGDISTDQITVGMIYKPAAVELLGTAAIPLNYGLGSYVPVGRSSLAQTIRQKSNGAVFTLVINHFKSKGSSSGGANDADANDGQGFSNGTRTRQAQDLLAWLATKPTSTNDPDYLLIGDFNAYAKEDPMTALATGGYTNLLSPTSYSYLFGGEFGSLDHAVGNASITSQVTGAEKWHINADEPTSLDYNTENKTTGQQSSLYSNDVFRSSDHDPILIGLNLCADPTIALSSAVGSNVQTVCATTAITPITYAIGGGGTGATVSGLPDGVTGSFNAGVFTISGSPTTAVGSPFNYTVTTSGGCSPAVTATGTITVNPVHTLTLTSATATSNQTLCIDNGITAITYSVGGGATNATVSGLPTGVTGAVTAGVLTINGTPSVSGSFNYSILTSGNSCTTASGSGTIVVNPNHVINLTSVPTTTAQTVCVNTPITDITYGFDGGATGATVNGLPNGVTANVVGKVLTITGTPTQSGSFNYTIVTTGNNCITVSAIGSMTISPAHTLTLTSATATENQTVCINTPMVPITYTLGGGATNTTVTGLPDGITSLLSGNVLTISGTPTNSGSSNYSIVTTGNSCAVANRAGTIKVNTKPSVAISYVGIPLEEGKTLELCDADSNPVNSLQFSVSTSCVSGATFWRVQAGSGAWSDWSTTAPTSQPSNNQPYRYQAACSDVTCTTTVTGAYTLTINYRAAVPQNVSLLVDGVTVAAGETKEVCSSSANTLTFNATCGAGEIILYSVDGSEYSTGIPQALLDNQFHNYRVRCRQAGGIGSCVESESGVMRLKLVTIPAAPTASLSATGSCNSSASFSGQSTCGSLKTIWYNATTNIALPNLPTTVPTETTSYYARCQTENGCVSEKSNVVTFTVSPTQIAPVVTASQQIVCMGTSVTISANCPAGSTTSWNTGVNTPSFEVSFNNVTKQTYWAKCIFEGGCQSAESARIDVYWNAFVVTLINIGESKSAVKTNDRSAWTSQFITRDGGPELEQSTQQNPTLYFVENANKIAPRYWTINVEACGLGTDGSLTFDMLATPEMGVVRSFNTHENNAPYFMYANREGWTELYAQNHPAYGFYQDNGSGQNVYDAGLPKGLYKLGIRYWDMKGWGSIYPATRKAQGNVLAYQEYWFRIQSKDGVGVGAARVAESGQQITDNGTFATVMPNPISNVLRLKVQNSKGQSVQTSLTDITGREVLSRSFVAETHAHLEEMETNKLETGVYLLKVSTSDKHATLKVVKLP
ncbi:putative extracellular nuclease [Runella defluvii]|uniref:Putative extracellular nuclease n=1 Tax=Runella defluvii TaxID=370973 RepID=A0A7W6ENM6_9BACT|nr:ExeM/NucH family extracellular endonuclease [Runella defluvii]MBB3836745.1 putative extracellular nuclease [Runella defluvii]